MLRIQARVSKRNNMSELGWTDRLAGKEAHYPEFTQYYLAWCFGHREYLLEQLPLLLNSRSAVSLMTFNY